MVRWLRLWRRLGLTFGPYEGIRFYAEISGNGWLAVDGAPEAVPVAPGDCVLLPRGRSFRVASDLAFEPINPLKTFDGIYDGGHATGDVRDHRGAEPLSGRAHWYGFHGRRARWSLNTSLVAPR